MISGDSASTAASFCATSPALAAICPASGRVCGRACPAGWCWAEAAAAAVIEGEGGGVAFRAGGREGDGFGSGLPYPKENLGVSVAETLTQAVVFSVIPEG